MNQNDNRPVERRQVCAREGCTTAPQWGERYCSVLHRRQDEILKWDDVEPESGPVEAPQRAEAETTETPERALLREVIEALDLPWHANYEDRAQRLDTITDRVNFVLGWVEGAHSNEDGRVTLGMAQRAAERFPVKYEVKGGVR